MTPFQIAGIAVCALFALASLLRLPRARPRWPAALGAFLGALGAVTINDPDMTTRWARAVGITRGADLLLYLLALAFLGSWFYFYQKLRTLTNDITTLVRAQAMRDVLPPVEEESKTPDR
jgi:hypothetical protein